MTIDDRKVDIDDELNEFECEILTKIQNRRTQFTNYFWKFWTFFGSPYIWIILCGIFIVMKMFHVSYTIFVIFISYFVIVLPLKSLIRRKRPYASCKDVKALDTMLRDFSFPSGHTFLGTISFFSFALIYGNIFWIVLSLILGGFVGFSRIYLGVHYITDVIISYFLAIFFAFLILWLSPTLYLMHELTIKLI
ncbi:MAG: phosphatase PAP2 family protein [Candidatus Lokiarchaeota archaeon]|nr:phosphatase PAP2 family protein [Candidatus Lokiarchaeota archaeon]MBD3339538.1 phosphatase PAP2 family protein [Candidatus Lokiarchaeota archaeon]